MTIRPSAAANTAASVASSASSTRIDRVGGSSAIVPSRAAVRAASGVRPVGPVRLARDVGGLLLGRQGRHEEPGPVAARLHFRGRPLGPVVQFGRGQHHPGLLGGLPDGAGPPRVGRSPIDRIDPTTWEARPSTPRTPSGRADAAGRSPGHPQSHGAGPHWRRPLPRPSAHPLTTTPPAPAKAAGTAGVIRRRTSAESVGIGADRSAQRGWMRGRDRDGGDQLHLDRRVHRQHRHAHGTARVSAGGAEDLAEQLARPVGDLGLRGEVGRTGHEDRDLHDPLDLVHPAGHGGDRGHRVQSAASRAHSAAVSTRDLAADLAGGHEFAAPVGQLARGVDQSAVAHRGNVRRQGLRHGGQAQSQLRQPLGRPARAHATFLAERPLQVGDQILRIETRDDLHQLPAVGAPVVEDLLGRVHEQRNGHVFPLGHSCTVVTGRAAPERLAAEAERMPAGVGVDDERFAAGVAHPRRAE